MVAEHKDDATDPRPPQNLTSRTLNGLAWVASASWGQAVLRLLVLGIMARLLSPNDFGTASMAMVIIGLAEIVGQIGVAPAIVQRKDLGPRHISSGFTFSILSSIVIGLCIYLAAPFVAELFREPQLVSIMQVLAILFPIRGIAVIAQAMLQREMKFQKLATIEVMSYLFGYGLVAISLGHLGFGLWALIYAQIAQASINSLGYLLRAPHILKLGFDRRAIADLIGFGIFFSAGRLGNYVAGNGDYFIVGRWLGAEALGIYSRAYQITAQPANLLSSVIDRVLFPALASVQDEKERMARAYRLALGTLVMLGMPMSVVLIILAPETIRILLGPGWDPVILPYQILVLATLPKTSYRLSGTMVRSAGAVMGGAWRQWIYALSVVFGAWAGHFYGPSGVAAGVAIAIFLHFFIMTHYASRLCGVGFSDVLKTYARHTIISTVVGIVTYLTKLVAISSSLTVLPVFTLSLMAAGSMLALVFFASPAIFGPEGKWALELSSTFWRRANKKRNPA
jgi:PST family polysaccharide transporter